MATAKRKLGEVDEDYSEKLLYREIPSQVLIGKVPHDATINLLTQMPAFFKTSQTPKSVYEQYVVGKPLRLDNSGGFNSAVAGAVAELGKGNVVSLRDVASQLKENSNSKEDSSKNKGKPKMSKSALKKQNLFMIDTKQPLPYETYLPLNEYWNSYMTFVASGCPHDQDLCARISQSDMHGAMVEVLACRQTHVVGLIGIVIQELTKCFIILDDKGKLHKVAKETATFKITVNKKDFVIHGCLFGYAPGQRSKSRIKPRGSLNFLDK